MTQILVLMDYQVFTTRKLVSAEIAHYVVILHFWDEGYWRVNVEGNDVVSVV